MPRLEIQASTVLLTPEEMRDVVGSAKMRELSGRGLLQGYVIAHEGLSQPRDLTTSEIKPMNWPRRVIEKIQDVIRIGTKWFKGHGDGTNSHANRKELGQVVGTLTKEIQGKTCAVVIGHFPDENAVKDLDVISMEANVNTSDDNTIVDIEDLSAIAMGDSRFDSPAFAGATRLASIHCFEQLVESQTLEKEIKKMPITQEELNTAPFAMLEQAIKTRKVYPSQLYTEKDLREDHNFAKAYTELDTLKTKTSAQEKEIEEIKKTTSEATRKAAEGGVKSTLDTLLKEGVTEKQRAWIAGRFNPSALPDISETGLKTFIESEKKEFANAAKLFGVAEGENKETNNEENKGNTERSETTGNPVEDALNDFLK